MGAGRQPTLKQGNLQRHNGREAEVMRQGTGLDQQTGTTTRTDLVSVRLAPPAASRGNQIHPARQPPSHAIPPEASPGHRNIQTARHRDFERGADGKLISSCVPSSNTRPHKPQVPKANKTAREAEMHQAELQLSSSAHVHTRHTSPYSLNIETVRDSFIPGNLRWLEKEYYQWR